ncbi:hypothetical protein FIV42_27255 [Persicimonas caeni]|uniref:Uncharacterized protein n=1 Tax=Persicimonas caeni TaxID=2292766 RepID=A0A4Y6Q1H4_PERCE|nr:hypothetical protein [Persicimonas caeni]QDG54309.1 hypothetical protein FIV42_27255 [Persicimonas caeni]QED35530.1 hypothetical protein FRD00_27250 [Persicimonas caeni]
MTAKKWITACAVALAVSGLSVAASAADFVPFSKVENVCPDCKKPKADVISMSNGSTIRGTVVAENTDFYTVVRYGEVRAVPRSSVQSIAWADGSKPSSLLDKDQIVLNNGHVLSGTIVDEKDEPAFFQIKSSFSDYTYMVTKSQVKKAYKGGSEYSFSKGG